MVRPLWSFYISLISFSQKNITSKKYITNLHINRILCYTWFCFFYLYLQIWIITKEIRILNDLFALIWAPLFLNLRIHISFHKQLLHVLFIILSMSLSTQVIRYPTSRQVPLTYVSLWEIQQSSEAFARYIGPISISYTPEHVLSHEFKFW